jgi:hypothetical protein
MKTPARLLAILSLFLLARDAVASSYYLSPAGNDASPGTLAQPWQTIARLNQTVLHPGDAIFFEGGQIFTGNIVLSGSGSDANPVVIGSYGGGVATIDSNSGTAIYGENTGGFHIQQLNLTNSGTDGDGISFFTDSERRVKYPGIIINNVEIQGVPGDGISIGSWKAANPGWDFVMVSNVKVHECGEGMSTYGYTLPGVTSHAIGWLYVSDSEFYSNDSSGLVLCGAQKGVVEYCSFHDNQSTGGCWTWGASGITIQHCLSANNRNGGDGDGFGFDLDGGSQNCTIQYCLSYGNDTPGFVIFDYTQSAATRNNTIRYCISENDVRADDEWGSFEIFPWADTPIANCHIYNCVACLTSRGGTTGASGFEALGKESSSGYGSGRTVGCSFRNSVVYLDGPGDDLRFFTGNPGATQPREVEIQGNVYYSTEGRTAVVFDDTLYTNFEYWRWMNPGQETLKGRRTGLLVNPLFGNVGAAHAIQSPYLLGSLASYRPDPSSPCIDRGLNLKKLFRINPGEFDFAGHSLPANGTFAVGAFEAGI